MNTTVNPSEIERCGSGDVGHRLRTLREGLGWTVADVSDRLRIRKVFLTAIEEGRYDALPGPTYAVGFIRAYADCLGWDGAEAVRQFRQESSIPSRQSSLDFPDPDAKKASFSKKPLLLFLGVVALVYGGWRLAIAVPADTSLFSLVQKVSGRVVSFIERSYFLGLQRGERGASSSRVAPASGGVLPGRDPFPHTVRPEEPTADALGSGAEPGVGLFPVSPILPSGDRTPSGSARDPAPRFPQGDGVSLSYPQSIQEPPSLRRSLRARSPLESVLSGSGGPDEEVEPLSVEEPDRSFVREPVSPHQPDGRRESSGARIVIRAVSDSWIQVRSPRGLVASRLMRKGESLPLPTQDDLELVTGNAGGLRIEVDGTELPAPGKSGEVRRGISLDPDLLKDSIRSAG